LHQSKPKKALVVVRSNVAQDPRVRRQIDWLAEEGWQIDSLGFGSHPSSNVRDHFEVTPAAAWTQSWLGLAVIHTFFSYRARFRAFAEGQFPAEAARRVRAGYYDVVIMNDTHFLPWLSNKRVFGASPQAVRVHIDLHEWFPLEVGGKSRGKFLMQGYHAWGRRHIAHPVVTSRSVAGGAGPRYAQEFGFVEPAMVRNMPRFEQQSPSAVNPDRIELIHHGLAAWARGFREMVDAMRLVDERFRLTFMLAGSQQVIRELQDYIGEQSDRVQIVPPAKMEELAAAINPYDVEVMFFPPTTFNLETALPNKLFESVQGRLAMVSGPTPTMAAVINEHKLGVMSRDWTPQALAEAINSLAAPMVEQFKRNSDAAAKVLNAEHEKRAFFRAFGEDLDASAEVQ